MLTPTERKLGGRGHSPHPAPHYDFATSVGFSATLHAKAGEDPAGASNDEARGKAESRWTIAMP